MSDAPFLGRSVLVIEDEPFTRMVMARMLASLGFSAVHQAADGAAGLQAVAAHTPDAVICDVEMAPMDGLGFLRGLRAQGIARLPVAFLTNRIDETRRAEAAALGADTFLAKPAEPKALAAALARLLP
jgi:two-component system, chemotaxis family, chemotaxis protein CheY